MSDDEDYSVEDKINWAVQEKFDQLIKKIYTGDDLELVEELEWRAGQIDVDEILHPSTIKIIGNVNGDGNYKKEYNYYDELVDRYCTPVLGYLFRPTWLDVFKLLSAVIIHQPEETKLGIVGYELKDDVLRLYLNS